MDSPIQSVIVGEPMAKKKTGRMRKLMGKTGKGSEVRADASTVASFQGKPLSINEAAQRLQVSTQDIYALLGKGKLKLAGLSVTPGRGQMLIPVDETLREKWITNKETGNGNSDHDHSNGTEVMEAVEVKTESSPSPTVQKIVERIIEKPTMGDQERAELERKIGELNGRLLEMEKSIRWEREARLKMEKEKDLLLEDRACLEGQLALSNKVERSLQKYSDKLERELQQLRQNKS